MSKFYKQHKIGILIFIYLGLIGAFMYFLAIPSIKMIQDQADQIEKKSIDNQKSRDRISLIPTMENAYDEYQAKKDDMNIVISSDQTIDFIKKTESLAEVTGNRIEIKINDIVDKNSEKKNAAAQPAIPNAAPGQQSNPNEVKNITDKLAYGKYFPVQVALKGDFQSLINFINKIENDQYFVNITSLQIKEMTEGASAVDVNNNVFQAVNQPTGGEENQPPPPPPPKPKHILSSNLNLIVYLKK